MAKKKTDPNAKIRVSKLHGLLSKAGPMKHRLSKRQKQRDRRYDESN